MAVPGAGFASCGRGTISDRVPSKSRKIPARALASVNRSSRESSAAGSPQGEGETVKSAPRTTMMSMLAGNEAEDGAGATTAFLKRFCFR
jgi:hypothetical protein